MNHLSSFVRIMRSKKISVTLVAALIAGVIGIPTFFQTASAAQLSNVSATASSSAVSANTNYMLRYTSTSIVSTGQSIAIKFSDGNSGGSNEFSLASLTVNDVVGLAGLSVLTTACGAITPNQVSISGGISNSAGNRSVTLTACGAVAAQQITIGFTNNHVTNPATASTYKVIVGGTQTDSGNTVVAIVNQTTMTASVDSTLVFTVAGVASGQTINGESVSTTSTATAIGFGTLASGTPVIAAQDFTVTTNAANGFILTVHEDQDMMSGNGSTIHLFNDGAAVATPIAWATPTAALGNVATYGHIGLTSDDTDLNTNEFYSGSVIKWAGNFNSTSTRTIFSNAGPADGVTQNIGKARVGYKILISALQAAGSDYVNHLIYVCTPTF